MRPAGRGSREVLPLLGLAVLGSGAGVVRAVWLEPDTWPSLFTLGALLWPVVLVGAACFIAGENHAAAARGASAGAGIAAAFSHFVLLHPELNRDANIGFGMYVMYGALLPLAPAALLGSVLSVLLMRGKPSAFSPRSPLRPWLPPLLFPALGVAGVALWPRLFPASQGEPPEGAPVALLAVGTLGALAAALAPALVALLLSREWAAHDGVVWPRLRAFTGLCLGLGVSLGLYHLAPAWLLRLGVGGLGLLTLPPLLGYGLGRLKA